MKKFKYVMLAALLFVGGMAIIGLSGYALFWVISLIPEWLLCGGLLLALAGVSINAIRDIYLTLKDKYVK